MTRGFARRNNAYAFPAPGVDHDQDPPERILANRDKSLVIKFLIYDRDRSIVGED